ncbi:MAG: c-type cytochrome [Nitrospiraceae bacterium]
MRATRKRNTVGTLFLVAVGAVGILAGIAKAGPKEAPTSGFAWKDGTEVYAKVCAYCHETTIGPVIRGRSLDPTFIRLIVRHGNRAMPAFRESEIDDQTLQKLAKYVSQTAADK